MNLRQSLFRILLRKMAATCLPPNRVANGLRILVYHRVRPDADDPRSVTPQRFREHLSILKAHWRVVSLDEVLAAVKGQRLLPEGAVLITFDDGYADLYDWAMPFLQEMHLPAIVFMLARYVGQVGRTYSEAKYPEAPFLSAAQLREMQRAGIEIGSHGLWHVPLITLPPKEAEREVTLSKAILSDLLGAPIRAFSYPWGRAGDFSDEHVAMVKRAGYEAAFTMLHGVNLPPFDPFRFRRCHVYPFDENGTFQAILEGRFDLWCLKNLPLWNRRKQWKRALKKFLMRDGSGRKF